MLYSRSKDYMFRPVVAIIRSLWFDTLKIIYIIVWWPLHSSFCDFLCLVFYDFLPLVLFCFLVFSWSLFFWFLVSSVCWYYQSIHLCIIMQFTHALKKDILHSNKSLDAEISSSDKPPQNYIHNLKCVEWQRPDDGHYRPKHVVFWSRI